MHVFLTVGTTRFDALVQKVITEEVQTTLKAKGYKTLTLQTGKSPFNKKDLDSNILKINQFEYKPSLSGDIELADLVISHAGAGTCLEVLEAKKPLIVVVNEELMDNHQIELAEKLSEDQHLVHCVCSTLNKTIETFKADFLQPFPTGNVAAFADFVDELFDVKVHDN